MKTLWWYRKYTFSFKWSLFISWHLFPNPCQDAKTLKSKTGCWPKREQIIFIACSHNWPKLESINKSTLFRQLELNEMKDQKQRPSQNVLPRPSPMISICLLHWNVPTDINYEVQYVAKKNAGASQVCSVSRSSRLAIPLQWWVQSAWAEARMASLAGLPERLEAFTPPDSLRCGVTNSLAVTKRNCREEKRICATSAYLICC